MKFTIIDTTQEKKQKFATLPAVKTVYIIICVTAVTAVIESPIMARGSGSASIAK